MELLGVQREGHQGGGKHEARAELTLTCVQPLEIICKSDRHSICWRKRVEGVLKLHDRMWNGLASVAMLVGKQEG